MTMLLHRLYLTLSPFTLPSILFFQRPQSILQYASNDYASVPFMTRFRTPGSLISRRMPFVPSRCYRTSLYAPTCLLIRRSMYPHLWDVLWTFAYCVHVLLFVNAVTS